MEQAVAKALPGAYSTRCSINESRRAWLPYQHRFANASDSRQAPKFLDSTQCSLEGTQSKFGLTPVRPQSRSKRETAPIVVTSSLTTQWKRVSRASPYRGEHLLRTRTDRRFLRGCRVCSIPNSTLYTCGGGPCRALQVRCISAHFAHRSA
jgi:hypothetical protein